MTSRNPGEFLHGGSVVGGGGMTRPVIGRNQAGNSFPLGFQQQQFQPQQRQQQQQPGMTILQDQIVQRRVDLLSGKRSFGDYQSYQQHINLLQLQQQRQQQQPLSCLQKLQQHEVLRNPSFLRSVKQRTIDLYSPTNNNNASINIHNINNSLTRFGVPVYQQQRRPQQQQKIPFNPLNNSSVIIPTINNHSINNTSAQPMNPVQVGGPNLVQPKIEPGSVNPSAKPGTSNSGHQEDHKILNTLQELEKHLLNDDDDDCDVTHEHENDAVSGVTNSEWSETFQNLMSPNPNPSPSPSPNNNSANNTNTTTNNNNVISPSPTSSTSSCCSTTASPPSTAAAVTAKVSAKELISAAAAAISDGKSDTTAETLSKLGEIANSSGNSEQRLAYYMSNALKSRAFPSENPSPATEEQISAVYGLYDLSPCFKFGLLAANLVTLEAITAAMQEGKKIHVIDFNVGHGAQYVNLLRALSERRGHAPRCTAVKITAVETELGDHGGVLDGLVGLAERVGVKLECSAVTRVIHELTRESLGVLDGEAVVVNFAFKVYRVPDESVSVDNLRDELLRRVKGLSPRAVTLVEQDMNGNTAPFVARVNEVCDYYGALLDSLDATLPRDNPDRCRVETGLGRKMVNSVACEGRDRVERAEVFGKWRARMSMAGFELKPMSQTVAESMRARLDSSRGGNPGFTVKEVNGGVGFGWMSRSLTVASAWR